MNARLHLCLTMAALAVVAGCGREEHTVVVPAAQPASTPTAAASAQAPAGPIIAPASAPAAPTQADRDAGAQLAAQGVQGAPACNTCHGAQGEGNPAAGAPRIAGQAQAYLLHELQSYAQGSRKHPVMQPIAAALNAQQQAQAATYFASLAPAAQAAATATAASGPGSAPAAQAAAPAASSTRVTARGGAATGGRAAQLAALGDESKGVQGCANCHGPGGIGSGEFYPYLAGQHASYLTATLGAWRDGSRNNDPTGQMPLIAKALSPEDTAALAAYFAAQPPRPDAIGAERMPAVAVSGTPAVTSGPQTASAATLGGGGSGQGTEQGSATTGGAQGPGGGGGTGAASTGQPMAPAAAGAAPAGAAPAAAGSAPAR